jgi:hypothetical protein
MFKIFKPQKNTQKPPTVATMNHHESWLKSDLSRSMQLVHAGFVRWPGVLFLDGFPVVASNTSYVAHGYPLAVKEAFQKAHLASKVWAFQSSDDGILVLEGHILVFGLVDIFYFCYFVASRETLGGHWPSDGID